MVSQRISEQYEDSRNLDARISIYDYALRKETLSQWLVSKFPPQEDIHILELGCGTGMLWKDLLGSFPRAEIILSDISEGMLVSSRSMLGSERFIYKTIDYHNIPFPDSRFDIVISNHNLYHAEDVSTVVSEIFRVLKPRGTLYATTNSMLHLAELRDFIGISGESLWPNTLITASFSAESGEAALAQSFPQIQIERYRNTLLVTDFDAIQNYLLSVKDERISELVRKNNGDIKARFNKKLTGEGGLKIRADVALFIASKGI